MKYFNRDNMYNHYTEIFKFNLIVGEDREISLDCSIAYDLEDGVSVCDAVLEGVYVNDLNGFNTYKEIHELSDNVRNAILNEIDDRLSLGWSLV